MIQIDLNREEKEILMEVIHADIADLGMEIADTDLQDYREVLKKRKRTLAKVLEALH